MSGFNLSALAVRERAVTLFFIVAISAAGLYAFLQLGRAEDPVFTIKVLTVSAAWPGATAQEMQDLVADPLEKRLQELRWYDRVETFTRPGLALMTLTLKDAIPPADVPEQFYQARKKLGDAAPNLPHGALGPFVNDEYGDVDFAIYALEAHGMPPRLLTREAEALRQSLLHVAGVQKVNILGERPERIFIDVSDAKLVSLGVSGRDIFAALARQNAVAPAGTVTTLGPQITIRLDGAYTDLDQIRDTPIEAGGRTLHLSDLADIRRGYEDPATQLIRHDGEPALLLSVVMQAGWNGLDLGRALEAESKRIADTLPAGISFSKVSDQAVNISESVDEFMLKFFVALAVVMAVSLLSLGWRVGIVVAAAVPLTLAAVFVIMLATGRVFDRITLGALILALGLLVDDAIIAIEIMLVRLEQGADRLEAASYAWSHTAAPMFAGTLVTIIGLDAGGLRQIDRRGICGQHLLDRRLRVARLLGGGRRVHAVSRRQAAAGDPKRARRPWSRLPDPALSAVPAPGRRGGATARARGRVRGRPVRAGGRGHDRGEAAVLPQLRPTGGARRGADARGQQHRGDECCRSPRRAMAEGSARSARGHDLRGQRRRAVLSWLQPGASRSGVRQAHRADA